MRNSVADTAGTRLRKKAEQSREEEETEAAKATGSTDAFAAPHYGSFVRVAHAVVGPNKADLAALMFVCLSSRQAADEGVHFAQHIRFIRLKNVMTCMWQSNHSCGG